jgi:hypothetical protein
MTRQTILAGAFAGLLAAIVAAPAGAVPLAKSPGATDQGIVEQVGRSGGHGPNGRGPGFGGGGGGGPRFHGGGGGPRYGGRPHFNGPGRHYGGGHRHYGGPRFRGYGFGAYPFYGYGGSYYYGGYSGGYGECGYLRRRAVATGSRYWWNRYYECIDD